MSEQTPVLTVRTEVESLLRFAANNYSDITASMDALTPAGTDFHNAVIDELNGIIEAYVNPPEPEEVPRFIVGGTYRLTGRNWAGKYGPMKGDIVTVVALDEDGDGTFLDEDGDAWYITDHPDWSGELVDTEIRVGDTVRILKTTEVPIHGQGNDPGVEFQVTKVNRSPWTDQEDRRFEFYVNGDPAGRGVWDRFIEKVYA